MFFFLQTSIRATFQVEAFQALEATREVVRKGDLAYARAEVSETARREAEETVKRQENEVSCPTSSSASEEYLFTFVGCWRMGWSWKLFATAVIFVLMSGTGWCEWLERLASVLAELFALMLPVVGKSLIRRFKKHDAACSKKQRWRRHRLKEERRVVWVVDELLLVFHI